MCPLESRSEESVLSEDAWVSVRETELGVRLKRDCLGTGVRAGLG